MQAYTRSAARLSVHGHHNGAIEVALRPHPDGDVGSVGHYGLIGGVAVPLIAMSMPPRAEAGSIAARGTCGLILTSRRQSA
jgi:hypothetical protein